MDNLRLLNETQITYHRRRLEELKKIRQPWEAEWCTLAEYIEPTRLRLSSTPEGPRSRAKIIDGTGTHAYDTLKSGMHSGLTSPARPWFRLTTFDAGLKKVDAVKVYLAAVQDKMREVFAASNIYRAFHIGYGDLGQFGQSCAILVEDRDTVIRVQQLVHGRFWIARDYKGRATTLYRVFRWSVQRIVERFGYNKVPNRVRQLYDTSKYGECFDIYHAIEPRYDRDPDKIDKRNKPFLSNYWMDEENSQLLEESGFDGNPIIAPSWELSDDNHYALSPGQKALGDIKMLQLEQKRKLEALDKQLRPPMTGPTSMKNHPASLLPGSITYVDDPNRMGYRPAMEVRLNLSDLREDIGEVQERVQRFFFADLFFAITNMEGVQPRNQLELTKRDEEKLLQLGPVLENVFGDQLGPTIDRTFDILAARDELPPPPRELRGQELKVEYISTLAQAQQAVSTGTIERGVAFIGQLAGADPEALDKLDRDEAIDLYMDAIGAPPSLIRADDKVKELRASRAQQMQQAQSAEMAATMAPALNQGAQAAELLASANQNPSGSALLQQLGIG
ncbi:phage tail protein [Rhizobium sp. RMa-01]|uniref:portal protein n=1 Tax=unclassified Rhizobium TaxID=2613769 RepID=UPI0008D9C9F7|nr:MULTISPECIES: portal protein [unclassified Rhizobium]OHV24938.1 phage tail protein [Rhizobium sp. RSm-3]RVU08355.1 phage tail protein [Rhizobium sp. RMa-01]